MFSYTRIYISDLCCAYMFLLAYFWIMKCFVEGFVFSRILRAPFLLISLFTLRIYGLFRDGMPFLQAHEGRNLEEIYSQIVKNMPFLNFTLESCKKKHNSCMFRHRRMFENCHRLGFSFLILQIITLYIK